MQARHIHIAQKSIETKVSRNANPHDHRTAATRECIPTYEGANIGEKRNEQSNATKGHKDLVRQGGEKGRESVLPVPGL